MHMHYFWKKLASASLAASCLLLPAGFGQMEAASLDVISPDYRAKAGYVVNCTTDEELAASPLTAYQIPAVPGNVNRSVLTVPAGKDVPEMELGIYRPRGSESENLPVIYYSHGGGFLFRGAYYNYAKYQKIADALQAAVVTPRYRISPEAPFPAAVLDAYHGLEYVRDNARALHLSDKIVIMGDSAGGNLTAALALYNRDHGDVEVAGEVLIYPMLDSRTGGKDDPYKAPNTGEVCWPRDTNVYAWQKLAGGKKIKKEEMRYYSPVRAAASELKGLPPTLIYVGDIDLFANEDLVYAEKLIEAGVKVELHMERGVYHAFDLLVPEAEQTQEFWQEIYRTTGEMLEGSY